MLDYTLGGLRVASGEDDPRGVMLGELNDQFRSDTSGSYKAY